MVTGHQFQDANDLTSMVAIAQTAIANKGNEPCKSGTCKGYYFENDQLICDVEYLDDRMLGWQFVEDNVRLVFANPFYRGAWSISLKDGTSIGLPDETTFREVLQWHQELI